MYRDAPRVYFTLPLTRSSAPERMASAVQHCLYKQVFEVQERDADERGKQLSPQPHASNVLFLPFQQRSSSQTDLLASKLFTSSS